MPQSRTPTTQQRRKATRAKGTVAPLVSGRAHTTPKPFTPLQKFGIVTVLLALTAAAWFFTSGRASTTIDLTLTTNPDLERGLVGHWTFDGPDVDWNDSDAFKDRSGNSLHLTPSANLTKDDARPGSIGQAFMHADDIVRYAYIFSATLELDFDWTISAWINTTVSGNERMILSKNTSEASPQTDES